MTGPTVVTAGQQYTLSCVTTAANPPATLSWRINGRHPLGGVGALLPDYKGVSVYVHVRLNWRIVCGCVCFVSMYVCVKLFNFPVIYVNIGEKIDR